MAFENLFVTLRDDEFGELWREEPLQPPDPPQFLDLFGDPRFEAAVQLRHLVGALTQFAQQPRVLYGDHRLGCEVLQQRDFFCEKRSGFFATGADRTQKYIIAAQW